MNRRVVSAAAAAGVLIAASAATTASAAEKIAIGPYIQNVTPESATICWSTLAGQSTIEDPDGKVRTIRHYRQHEMLLANLRPNTTYRYNVLGDESAEGKGTVTTYPDGVAPFRFAVFGDTRSHHAIHQKLVDRIIAEKTLFVINTGDLVSDGQNIEHWEMFFKVNRRLMRTIGYYPVLGNHERDSKHYFEFFNLPGNERYYSFIVGDAFFLMLDTEGEDYPTPDFVKKEHLDEFYNTYSLAYFERQKAWAEHRLRLHKDAGFIFVVFHQPLFSVKGTRVEDAKLRRAFWGDIFERNRVQVVLTGHDHHYHHAFQNGTHYVTTGGGGAGLYDGDALQPQTVKFAKAYHYITVDVGKENATLAAIGVDGQAIDKITVTKRR